MCNTIMAVQRALNNRLADINSRKNRFIGRADVLNIPDNRYTRKRSSDESDMSPGKAYSQPLCVRNTIAFTLRKSSENMICILQ